VRKEEISVLFETITPVYTGDAWQNCTELRPSSILGSLRFWFEVLCYFKGEIGETYFDNDGKPCENLNYKKFKEKLEEKLKNSQSKSIEELEDEVLADMGISLPSRIFGCTGWRGRIRIKKIEPIEDYCFGNRLNLPYAIGENKENKENKENNENVEVKEWQTKNEYDQFIEEKYSRDNKKFKKDWSVWYFPHPYFYGKFKVIFETDEKTKEAVLVPLLNIIEKYGYLGGKWNLGYGRVKIKEIIDKNISFNIKDWKSKIELQIIGEPLVNEYRLAFNVKEYELMKTILECDKFFCKTEKDFKNKTANIPKEVRVIKFNDLEFEKTKEIKNLIEKLLVIKMTLRSCLRPRRDVQEWKVFRHKLLGTTEKPIQGSKILPYIYEENGKLKGGFISIAGILNMKGGYNE